MNQYPPHPGPIRPEAARTVHALPHGADTARALARRLDEFAARQLTAVAIELPEWTVERPDLEDRQRAIAHGSLRDQLETLRTADPLPTACPVWDLDLANLAATVGAPLAPLLATYRLGAAMLLDAWIEEVEQLGLTAPDRLALIRAGSAFFSAYAGRLSDLIGAAHTSERDRALRGTAQRRVQLVNALLAGVDVGTDQLEHELDGHHVAVIVWGPGAGEAITALAQDLDRRLLLLPQVAETWWAWLSGVRPLDDARTMQLTRWLPPADVRAAISGSHPGIEGFRRAHEDARLAHRAAQRRDDQLVPYATIALEALASADEAAARRFVDDELLGLNGDDRRSAGLRATLAAYFAAGHNAAATARRLGVHEQTVVNRLRTVETLIGAPVNARRAELETALRLRIRFAAGP